MARFNLDWWTKERVESGLRRYIEDFFAENPEKLPTNLFKYTKSLPDVDKQRRLQNRLYPPADAVLRVFDCFAAAWWKLGYLVEVRSSKKKYNLTPEIEARLREIYSYRFNAKERPKDLPGPKEYARQLGIPEFVTTKWAQDLGLSHTKESAWSDEEITLLDEFGYQTPTRIQILFAKHGFIRSSTAILLMRKRRMSHKASPYFSANAVANLFRIDGHVIQRWCAEGLLKFELKGTERGNRPNIGDTKLIRKDWIYDFIVQNPDKFDIKKVDQYWFLHILTKGDVKLMTSSSDRVSKRTEGQQIDAPVEFRKSKAAKPKQLETI